MNKWILNFVIALLAGMNSLFWGWCIKDLREMELTLVNLPRLVLNIWFILAVGIAFVAAILRFSILSDMGVLEGAFFLMTSAISTILVAHFFLGEVLTTKSIFGIILIMIGSFIIGMK